MLACLFAMPALAQQATSIWNGHLRPDPEPSVTSTARYAPGPVVLPQPLTGGCPTNDAVGSAVNVFTNILTEASPIAVDNDINTIIFTHRNNATAFGGHGGQLRYDISTNGGLTWTLNQGVLNPLAVNGTNGARYPSCAIYNPAGNTVANNAYLGYYAPTVGAAFNGTVSGVRRLNGAGNTETYNQPTATQTLIPRSMVKGAPGTFWAIDNVYNGTAVTGYRVLKGVWNGSTDIVWTVNTTINPTFNTAYDAAVRTADYAIAFDPTGTTGWICMLTHLASGPANYAYYPVFYKTTNGGTTWSGPTTVDLGQFPCISSNIQVGNVTSTAFDMDLTVDVNGNPHALMAVCNGTNAYSVFFTQWHAMVDVTMSDGLWNPVILRNVYRGRGNWGTAPNNVSQDMEPQVSRTADGTKVFFAWADADSSVLQATADVSPNLYAKAYDVVQRKWTNSYNMTGCNVTWGGKILFPKLAENVLSNTGNYKLPVVFAEMTSNDPALIANFHYLDSIWFAPSDFINNQCAATVSIATQDTIISCGSTTLDAGPGAQAYLWSTGATTQAITVTSSGSYSVAISSGCCTGTDAVYILMISAPAASFTSSSVGLTASYTDNSNAQLATYSWDFGDGAISSLQNPSHTYALAGTYQVCLTVTNSCGSNTTCNSVTVVCNPANATFSSNTSVLTANFTDLTPGTPSAWAWDFGDGNFDNTQNPTHVYVVPGTFNVCLTITDACGQDSSCQTVTVCELPTAAFGVANVTLGQVDFTDQSTSGTSWAWTFGDGGTSNLQNPQHTYAASGTYQVCLTVTDACGSDSACTSVTVNVVGIADGMGGHWSVSPIPAHDLLVLTAQNAGAGKLQLRLMNTLGQLLVERDLTHLGGDLQERFDISALPKGVYYLEVRSETGHFVAKCIKE